MKNVLFAQCLICVFLLTVTIILTVRGNQRAAEAGTFCTNTFFNDTLADFSNNIFGEFFDE